MPPKAGLLVRSQPGAPPGAWTSIVAVAALLAACASSPPAPGTARPGPAPSTERDGPEATNRPDLAQVPDAEPRIEPIRAGGPNKPYEVFGRDHVPITDDRPFRRARTSSWAGAVPGRRTASGEAYNMYR